MHITGSSLNADPQGTDYYLSWSDEFNGTQLDSTRWNYRYLGPRRDAINVTNAVSVESGNLVIRTYSIGTGGALQHYTGMIGTQGLFHQQYGYFEARIDFDGQPGMWSAFWIQSPTMGDPIGDPGTAGAEVDIMEHRVINGSSQDFSNIAHHALHWDGYGTYHQSRNKDIPFADLAEGYHLYGLEWSPTGYKFYVDDQLTWTISLGLSHRDEYLILSSEVEDSGWAGEVPVGGYGSYGSTTAKMLVDYVRVYQHSSPGDLTADGYVGLDDLDVVLTRWNQDVSVGDRLQGDPSGDGYVGLDDLDIVLGDWNNGSNPPANLNIRLPEPASLIVFIVGVIFQRVRPNTELSATTRHRTGFSIG